MKGRQFDGVECSYSAIEHRPDEDMSDDLILKPTHKIFLSHSGVQKEFVEHLCKALEDRCHYPFFDGRPESLPKGKQFPGLIVKAAQQCQLLVVVVSEEYFMSKWPMIELNAFMQAKKEMRSNLIEGILPLFYGLSVSDLKDEKRRQRWLKNWESFAKDDQVEGRIKVEDWSYAVDELTKFNGLTYDQELKRIVAYENEIVSHICRLVPSDLKWDDSHVHGHAHEVILESMSQIGLSPKYNVKVVGIYGVGGIGKTTACKSLCNEVLSEYEGRVCHVEFDSSCSNFEELLQKVLINLTRKSADLVQHLGEGECINVLRKSLFKQRTFLVIDDVSDNENSIKRAKMLLKTPSHEGSLVVVTARSQSTLALLGIGEDACLEMPELGQGDATNLFLHYAADGEQFTTQEDKHSIAWCVNTCYFYKGGEGGFHYHPLALEALGRHLGCLGETPSKWKQLLSRVWKLNMFLGENVVFDVLRSSFDLLKPNEQTLFMDVGFFLPRVKENHVGLWRSWIDWTEQLGLVYKRDAREIQSQLDSLKRKGLLQDADLKSGIMNMHDLYSEFVKLEAIGKSGKSTDMWNRKWVFVDGDVADLSELEVTPAGGCWQKLSRLSIRQKDEFEEVFDPSLPDYGPPTNPITILEGIEWHYFSNVLVLQLYCLTSVHGRLNLKGMKCLRSLQIYKLTSLERLEGLESLKNLTNFDWKVHYSSKDITTVTHVVSQFPESLRYLYMSGQCVLSGSDMLARCKNLIKLTLELVEVGVLLDLSTCSSLESVRMFDIKNLQTISGLAATRASRLQALDVRAIRGIHIPGLEQLDGLNRLSLARCGLSEVPCLLSLTRLQTLIIGSHTKSAEHCLPHQIQELSYARWTQSGAPCLNAFKQLKVLDFSFSITLTQMYGLGDLPALRSVDLSHCENLERLPDLSKSRNLEEINLDCCDRLKLHEEDFEMLARLPLLRPVQFSHTHELHRIKLDIVGRKVLYYVGPGFFAPAWPAWKEGGYEELELGLPPVEIGNRGPWDTYEFSESDSLRMGESDMEDLEDIKSLEEESGMEELEDVESAVDVWNLTANVLNLTSKMLNLPWKILNLTWKILNYIDVEDIESDLDDN